MSVLQINKKKHIFWAEINRPETNNSIDFEVMDMLEKLLDEIEGNNKIRVLVLSGSGNKYFVSGGNIKAFANHKTEKEGQHIAERMTRILERLENNRFWTMACVDGEVYGGGCELLLAFDFAIASKTATFAFTQASFGLSPGWGGITRLVERVGRSRALEWLGSSQVVTSEEAFQTGLINKLSITSEIRKNAWKWALELSRIHPDLIEELKKGTLYAIDNPRDKSLKRELEQFARLWASPQHHKKVTDFLGRTRKQSV